MSRLTRDGTAEPVSRDHIFRRERGRGNIYFPCSADHEQNWQPYPVDQCSCYMCYHISYMVINVNIQYNGGFLPGIILLTLCDYIGKPFQNHQELLSLQPMFLLPPKPLCVCVFFPSILDIKFVGRTSRGHTGGRSHRIFNPPSFCGACLDFCREKDSAIPFPRRP